MKKMIYIFSLILFSGYASGQLFNQDFSSSSVLNDYWSATPTQNQFNEITNSANFATSITEEGVLRSVKKTAYGILYRSTGFGTPNESLIIKFKFRIFDNLEGGTNQISFFVGSGLPGRADAVSTSNCHSRFGINFSNPVDYPEGFSIRNLESGTNGSIFLGPQNITMVINNTGALKTYVSPANTIDTLENDKIDIWVATTKVHKAVAAYGANVALENFKLLYAYGAKHGTMEIDDFSINAWKGWGSSKVSFNINNGTDTEYLIGNSDGNTTELNNYDFDSVSSLRITAADIAYWSDTNDRTGSQLFYKITSEDGLSTVVDTTEVNLSHSQLPDNTYKGLFSGSVDLLSGLSTNVRYKLHVWAKSSGSTGEVLLNNGDTNYVATFVKSPTTSAVSSPFDDVFLNVSVQEGILNIDTDKQVNMEIYSVNGTLIDKSNIENNYSIKLSTGFYLLKVNNKSYKILVK